MVLRGTLQLRILRGFLSILLSDTSTKTPGPLWGQNPLSWWACWVCWHHLSCCPGTLQCRRWCWSPLSDKTPAAWFCRHWKTRVSWEIQVVLTDLTHSNSVFSPVQLIVYLDTQILKSSTVSRSVPMILIRFGGVFCCLKSTTSSFIFAKLSYRWST